MVTNKNKEKDKQNQENLIAGFAAIFKEFGSAVAEVFNDPALKEKAKDFANTAADSVKVFGGRLKDEEVREKFKRAGRAAIKFGKQMEEKGAEVGKKGIEIGQKGKEFGTKVGRIGKEIAKDVKEAVKENIEKS